MMKILLPILAVLMTSFAAAEGGTGSAVPGVSLPAPPMAGTMSLEEALAHRRSVREFSAGALTLAEISRLVWAAQGVTDSERRTAPSAGATYPLEVYLVAADVEGLVPGVYRYRPGLHRLEAVTEGDIRLPRRVGLDVEEAVDHARLEVGVVAI